MLCSSAEGVCIYSHFICMAKALNTSMLLVGLKSDGTELGIVLKQKEMKCKGFQIVCKVLSIAFFL